MESITLNHKEIQMSYEEIMNNDTIQFVILHPGLSEYAVSTVLKKQVFEKTDMEKYEFDKIDDDKIYFKQGE